MTTVVMPQLGESVMEGTVVRWIARPGQKVERDEPLVEIATDKANTEIPSPSAGVLVEQLAKEGAVVTVGSIAAKLRTTTSGAPPLILMPHLRRWKACSTSTAKMAAAKAGKRPAAPSEAIGSILFTGYCATIRTASAVVAPATGSVSRRFDSDKAVATQA